MVAGVCSLNLHIKCCHAGYSRAASAAGNSCRSGRVTIDPQLHQWEGRPRQWCQVRHHGSGRYLLTDCTDELGLITRDSALWTEHRIESQALTLGRMIWLRRDPCMHLDVVNELPSMQGCIAYCQCHSHKPATR